jgi:hypothetical protein
MTKEEENLLEYINEETIYSVMCSNCLNEKIEHNYDPIFFVEECVEEGWKVTKYGNIYCPECAKKKLKGKKKNG